MGSINRPATLVAVAGLTVLALLLRLHNLGYESLDIDEADVVAYALQDWPGLLHRFLQPGETGPLYLLLLRLWVTAAGHSELALRLFSVLPAVASVPALYLLGRRLVDERSGLVAAALLTLSTYHIYFAQMTKMYALLLLLALLSCLLLLQGLQRPAMRTWVAYVVVTTAAMYTHVFGALLLPWHALFALTHLRTRREALKPWLLSTAALTLPYLPLAAARLGALRNPETLTRQFTGPQDLPGMAATLAREYGTRYDLLPAPVLAAFFLGLTALGAAALVRRYPLPAEASAARWFLGLGLALPLLVTYAMVTLGAPLFSSRYLILTLPVFYVTWGAGIAWLLQTRWLPVGAVLLMLFIGLNAARWTETAVEGKRFREDWRGGVARLEARYQPGDLVVVLHDSSFHALRYYATDAIGIANVEGGPERPPDITRLPDPPLNGRVWLLAAYFEAPDLPPVEAWLSARGALVDREWENGVMLSRYQLRP